LEGSLLFLFWLIIGLVLALTELVIPGAVVMFVGLGALTSAGFIYFGFIDSWTHAFICWFISSIIYLFTLRSLALRVFPGDEEVGMTDEDEMIKGQIVEVSEDISKESAGRIHFMDTSFTAESEQPFKKGEKARILHKKNNGFIVGPIKEEE
jgi:membrane protein implicated in regulation of membrane protease activity